jgi:glutaredoxin
MQQEDNKSVLEDNKSVLEDNKSVLEDNKSVLEDKKETNVYTIYTKSACPFCVKAKNFLREKKQLDTTIHFVENNCDMYLQNAEDKEQFLQDMKKHCGKEWRTFPMIFHRGQFIGGYTDLVQYYNQFISIANEISFNVSENRPAINTKAFFDSNWEEDMDF